MITKKKKDLIKEHGFVKVNGGKHEKETLNAVMKFIYCQITKFPFFL